MFMWILQSGESNAWHSATFRRSNAKLMLDQIVEPVNTVTTIVPFAMNGIIAHQLKISDQFERESLCLYGIEIITGTEWCRNRILFGLALPLLPHRQFALKATRTILYNWTCNLNMHFAFKSRWSQLQLWARVTFPCVGYEIFKVHNSISSGPVIADDFRARYCTHD